MPRSEKPWLASITLGVAALSASQPFVTRARDICGMFNRDMTSLRAALNLAMADGLVRSDFAWRGKPRSKTPISGASCTLIVRSVGCS